MKIENTEIKIVQGDITELKVDAIVNAANNKLEMGGGVAGAIKRKGGQIIEDEALRLGPIEIGKAVATSAGKLPVKYVIHAATMGLDHKTDELKIRDAAKNTLELAGKLKVSSLAFCALGCGVGGFPLLASAKILAQETLKYLRSGKTSLGEIIFCLYDKEAFSVFNKGIISYLEYVTTKLKYGPYSTVDAIIEIDGGIVVVERSNPPFGWALPGGFVDYGESLEEAVKREVKEETGLELTGIEQFHIYSAPDRDPRFHTISTVFIGQAKGEPKAGDDAAAVKIINPRNIGKIKLAFDHAKIINDYLKHKKG